MSIESALISQAGPYIVAAKQRSFIQKEAIKGCSPEIFDYPVCLEPTFVPLWRSASEVVVDDHQAVPDQIMHEQDLVKLRVWISPEQQFDWSRSEHFIKQQQIMSRRATFYVIGNNDGIAITFLCHKIDVPILTAAFRGIFADCELTVQEHELFSIPPKQALYFREFFPSPPYSHLLTRPDELRTSPLVPLISVISAIQAPSVGVYQILYQPVSPDHNWYKNVQILLDLEYVIKLQGGFHIPQRYFQQSPSGDLHQMANELETKAHNDKPFYAVVFRLGVICEYEKSRPYLDALSTFAAMFLHGGRPLQFINEVDYAQVIQSTQLEKLFATGMSYRPGFLVNSQELTSLIHIPAISDSENHKSSLKLLETLPVRKSELSEGTWIGTCEYAGQTIRVCIPDEIRKKHARLIGKPGVGKSTAQERMILSDIEQGHGVAVLDPHGDLINRLLCVISESYVEKIIYFNPGDPDWIAIWNPLKHIPGQDIGRTADEIVQAIQSFVSATGWGDRLEHLLRNMVFSLIHLSKGTFFDISTLLQSKSEESKKLRNQILKVVDNETVRRFWLYDYEKYGKDDFGPPKNKLSKLMVSTSVSLMLSQPDSLFNFRQIMDEGKILLVDLSTIGPMIRGILGCFILSLLHLSALSRSKIPIDQRQQFHIHCDEAHRFMTDSLEDLIAETRKYNVSLSLAHQYMSQFGKKKSDAFSSVGSTIIFNVDSHDAQYLIKDLQKKVKVEDITGLGRYEAIAHIGTEIVRFTGLPPLPIPQQHFREKIIAESHKKYYRPAFDVRKQIRRLNDRWSAVYSELSPLASNDIKEFEYDEFCKHRKNT
jgi:hypothetical protein